MESSKIKKNLINIFLLVLSSILFTLANPNFVNENGFGFLAWFYYIPVLLLIDNLSLKKSFLAGGFYGCLSYGLYAFWLIKYDLLTYFAVCLLYFLIFSSIFLLIKITKKLSLINSWFYSFIILSVYEIVKTYGFLGFSYGEAGYTQWKYLYFNQIAKITGVHGISVLIIFNSCLIYGFIDKFIRRRKSSYGEEKLLESNKSYLISEQRKIEKRKRLSYKPDIIVFSVFLLCIVCAVIYSVVKLKVPQENKTITIAAIQNNEDPWKNGLDNSYENIKNLIDLTEDALEMNPDIKIVVWPETAVVPAIEYNYYHPEDVNRNKLINALLNYLNKKNCYFVIGNFNRQLNDNQTDDKVHNVADRYSDYNSSLFFSPNKNIIPPSPEVYSKIHLVPFTEYFPYSEYFPNLYKLLLNGDTHMWEKGTDFKVFTCEKLKFSTPICFEDTFCDICSQMVRNGACCFINLSNDSWSKSKVSQMQHLTMAVFRSIENDVPSVRSTSSGETCIILGNGKIQDRTSSFCKSYVCGEVPVLRENHKKTVFTRYGKVSEQILILCFLLILIIKIFIVIINHLIDLKAKHGR